MCYGMSRGWLIGLGSGGFGCHLELCHNPEAIPMKFLWYGRGYCIVCGQTFGEYHCHEGVQLVLVLR